MIDWSKVKHFNENEFKCSCCGKSAINENLVYMLDSARELACIPFKINSAYRCISHNNKIGGVIDSAHTKGLAVDISVVNDDARFRIASALLNVGFKRVLLYATFIHCDIDLEKVNPILKIMK